MSDYTAQELLDLQLALSKKLINLVKMATEDAPVHAQLLIAAGALDHAPWAVDQCLQIFSPASKALKDKIVKTLTT